MVCSRVRSRSNSASAAKTWNTSRPLALVVSIGSFRLRNPILRLRRSPDEIDQVTQVAADAVQAPRDQHVLYIAQMAKGVGQFRSFADRTACTVDVDPLAAGLLKGVDLQ